MLEKNPSSNPQCSTSAFIFTEASEVSARSTHPAIFERVALFGYTQHIITHVIVI